MRENPEDAKALSELGGALNNLAAAQPDLDASPRAVDLVEEAMAHQRAALRLRPDDRTSQGYLRNHLENLAVFQHALGKEAEAIQAIREVVQICEEFVRQFPAVPSYRDDLYASYMNWGSFLKRSEPAEAERLYRRALEVGEALVKDFPNVPAYRRDLASGYHNLLLLIEQMPGRGEDVAKAAERAVALYESLKELTPSIRVQLATCYLAQDVTRRTAGRNEEAASDRRQAIGQLEKAIAARRNYGEAWRLLALARHRDGGWKESLAAFAELRRLKAVQSGDLFRAAVDHWRLGDRGQARQCFIEGEALLKRSAGGAAADRADREEAAKLLGMLTSVIP